MPIEKLTRPTYAESFRCIGSACEDTCCQDWTVPVDQATFEKFQSLPNGPMRTHVEQSVVPKSENATPATFAIIQMAPSGRCPMLSENSLCGMQQAHGEEFLPHVCATYPRVMHSNYGLSETSLTLSCPEAARHVLLNPKLMTQSAQGIAESNSTNAPYFGSIRDFALNLIRNRTYPLWQRLFLLGIFARRFDALPENDLPRIFPGFLRDFTVAVNAGSLRPAMESLPSNNEQQLDMVLQLAGLMLHRSIIKQRFIDCVQAFTQGIGNGPGATLSTLTAQYTAAHDAYYAPFFEQHPHILENYLVNTIFRCQFPFGREDKLAGARPSMTRETALLATQFALMKGLLIGVAGFHRAAFSEHHVIHTVQAASKHFEHHPEFLNLAHNLLVENKMDDARGLTVLLRNGKAHAARPAFPSAYAPGSISNLEMAMPPSNYQPGNTAQA